MDNVTQQREVVRVQQDTQDNWSGWYNATARFRYPHISPLRKIVHTLRAHGVPRASDMRVLEFGFGHGHLLFWFKPPTAIYGIELSEQAVGAARKRAAKKGYKDYVFKRIDVENSTRIDFPDRFFDMVVTSHALEHVWDDEAALREFHRVLRPGGRLLLVVPHDAAHSRVLADWAARRNPAFPGSSYHVYNYNVETLVHLTEVAGFRVVHAERFDAVMSWRQRWNRALAMSLSVAMPVMPYSIFGALDRRAQAAGYVGMQALILGAKAQ